MTARDELRREMVHNHLYMTEERADELINALLAEAANRVRPVEHRGRTICVECSAWADGSTDNPPTAHPCATIRALDTQEET